MSDMQPPLFILGCITTFIGVFLAGTVHLEPIYCPSLNSTVPPEPSNALAPDMPTSIALFAATQRNRIVKEAVAGVTMSAELLLRDATWSYLR